MTKLGRKMAAMASEVCLCATSWTSFGPFERSVWHLAHLGLPMSAQQPCHQQNAEGEEEHQTQTQTRQKDQGQKQMAPGQEQEREREREQKQEQEHRNEDEQPAAAAAAAAAAEEERLGQQQQQQQAHRQADRQQALGPRLSNKTVQSDAMIGQQHVFRVSAQAQALAAECEDDVSNRHAQLYVGAETEVRVSYSCYRVVICVQLSPSLACFDPVQMCCGLDYVLPALEKALAATLLPGHNCGDTKLHVVVVVRGLQRQPLHVLLSLFGVLAGESTHKAALATVTQRLREVLEQFIADQQTQQKQQDGDANAFFNAEDSFDASEDSIGAALSDCSFCLTQLPKAACPVIFLLTDGTLPPPEATTYSNTVTKLQEADVACSVISFGTISAETTKRTNPFGLVGEFSGLDSSTCLCNCCSALQHDATPVFCR